MPQIQRENILKRPIAPLKCPHNLWSIVIVKMFARWLFANKKYLLGSERRNLET